MDKFFKFLFELKNLPLWIIKGAAVICWIVFLIILIMPSFRGINIESFRKEWGVWVFIGAIAFTIFAILKHKEVVKTQRVLRFIPLRQSSFWVSSQQSNGSFVSSIRATIQASNTSDYPVQIVGVRLIKPKKPVLLQSHDIPPPPGNQYHSDENPVPPRGTIPVNLFIYTQGKLAAQGRPVCIKIGVVDQHNKEYKIKMTIRSADELSDKHSVLEYIKDIWLKLFGRLFGKSMLLQIFALFFCLK